jgi:hypothetical protein
MPPPGFRISDKFLIGEVIRGKPVPDAIQAAKIGNSRFGANPNTGENYRPLIVNN